MFSFCCFAFESGQHCGKKVYAMYFGWEEGSVEGTWAKAFKSCRCANFLFFFHCFYFILVLLFCLFGLLQLEGIVEVHFFPFFLFDLWCCIVSIDYNKNFFVFSRASHQVRLFYVFGFFIVLLLWFLSSIEQQVCLFCFFFLLVLWLCLWLLLLPFMLTTFCSLLLLLFSCFEFVPLGVVVSFVY